MRRLLSTIGADAATNDLLMRYGTLPAVLDAATTSLPAVMGVDASVTELLTSVRLAMLQALARPLDDRPVLSSSQSLADYLHVAMAHTRLEEVRVLYLTAANRLLRDEIVTTGTIDTVPLYAREVLRRALELGAAALIVVHNHPSGDPTPSRADLAATRSLVEAARHLDIRVHDHLVVARSAIRSLRGLGLM